MNNVLVTGGAGFIGSHTTQALINNGYGVRILDSLDPQIHGAVREFPGYLNSEIECIQGDVRDPSDVNRALDGVDTVFHMASLTGVGQSMYDIRPYVDTNCTGTATLLESIIKRKATINRVILTSSRAVYGEGTHVCSIHGNVYPKPRKRSDMERGIFEVKCPQCDKEVRSVATGEDRPLTPTSVYAWTKKEQEELCRYVADTFGIPITILRYFNVYGSRQSLTNPYTGVVSIFYSRLMSGQPISLYEHGKPGRDFVHISDVVNANLATIQSDLQPGTTINVGHGTENTIWDVAEALGSACNQPPVLHDRGEFRVGDIHSCYADISRARQLLSYKPRVDLQEGMKEFVAWAAGQKQVDLYEKAIDELRAHGLFGKADTKSV